MDWFHFLHQFVFLNFLFLACYRVQRVWLGPLESWVSVLYVFVNNFGVSLAFASKTGPDILTSLKRIFYGGLHLLNPFEYVFPLRWLGKFPSRSIDLTFCVIALCLMLRGLKSPDRRGDVAIALLHVATLYTNPTGWKIYFVLYGAYVALRVIRGSADLNLIASMLISSVLAGVGLFQMTSMQDTESLLRLGVLMTHAGSLEYSALPLAVLVVLFIRRHRWRHSAESRSIHEFLALVMLGFILLSNQNVLTGLELQQYHIPRYTNVLCLLCLLAVTIQSLPGKYRLVATALLMAQSSFAVVKTGSALAGIDRANLEPNSESQSKMAVLSPILSRDYYDSRDIVSYVLMSDRLRMDFALEASGPFFAFQSYPPVHNLLSLDELAGILCINLLIAESLDIDEKLMLSTYNHYSRKAFHYYFRGPPARISADQRPFWRETERAYVDRILTELTRDQLASFVERGGLKYVVRDEVSFGSLPSFLRLSYSSPELDVFTIDRNMINEQLLDYREPLRSHLANLF